MKESEPLIQILNDLASCELNDHGLLHKSPLAYMWRINRGFSEQTQQLNRIVLLNEEFQSFPASIDKHHAVKHGLALHTAQVLFSCVGACRMGMGLDYEALCTAAIWHDFGKTKDYEVNPAPDQTHCHPWRKTPHAYKVRHLVESWAMFKHALAWSVKGPHDPNWVLEVEHCILTHHGIRARGWGSAVDPMTREAHILHHADMLSIGMDGGTT